MFIKIQAFLLFMNLYTVLYLTLAVLKRVKFENPSQNLANTLYTSLHEFVTFVARDPCCVL